jgi:hypothetical protein
MPCTRTNGDPLLSGLEDDYSDDLDPDYRESDSGEEDDLPPSMQRDRAQWVVDNTEDLEWLFTYFRDLGRSLFGRAFFQHGNITDFSHFVYKFTSPGAVPV